MVKGDLFSAQTSVSIMKLIFPAKKAIFQAEYRMLNRWNTQSTYIQCYVEQVEIK